VVERDCHVGLSACGGKSADDETYLTVNQGFCPSVERRVTRGTSLAPRGGEECIFEEANGNKMFVPRGAGKQISPSDWLPLPCNANKAKLFCAFAINDHIRVAVASVVNDLCSQIQLEYTKQLGSDVFSDCLFIPT